MPFTKGIGCCHKRGKGNNQGRQQTTPRDDRCFNCNNCHSNNKNLSLPVIAVSPPLNNPVINPYQMSSVCQQSSRSSNDTPRDNRCLNSKDSNSNSNEFPSPVIPVPPPLDDSVINPTQLFELLSLLLKHRSSRIRCPRFVNSHPDLHMTLLVITGALIARTVTQTAELD